MGGCKTRFLGDFILSKQLHLLISVANLPDIFLENRIIHRHICIFSVNLCCPFNVYLKAWEHRKTSIFAQIGPLLAISFCFEVSNAERRQQKIGTGCFIWKVEISNGCSCVRVHIWRHVGKANMCLRGGRFFQFSKICLHFLAVCLQFFKKSTAYQTHFGFSNIGSNMHRFSSTSIYFW